MNFFNLINCRKINIDDTAIFERFTHNWTFLLVLFGLFGAQIALVEWCSVLLHVQPTKSRSDWGGAMAVGSTTMLVAFLLKFTPESWVKMAQLDRFASLEDTKASKNSFAGRVSIAYSEAVNKKVDYTAMAEQMKGEKKATLLPTDEERKD